MKKLQIACLVVVIALLAGGCATGKKFSDYGLKDPEDAISFKSPVQAEKENKEYYTIFNHILDVGMYGTESHKGTGVWPILAKAPGSKIIKGYTVVTDLNHWGDFVSLAQFSEGKEKFNNAKFIILNRDGGNIYDLQGNEYPYDVKRFEKDEAYQDEMINKHGMTLNQIDAFWRSYTRKRGIEVKAGFEFVKEIKIGSAEWDEFKSALEKRFSHFYKMPDGSINMGVLPINEFRREAVPNYGVTMGQRVLKNAGFNPAAFVGGPIVGGASVLGSLFGAVLQANLNDDWGGYYDRANALRGDLKPMMRQISQMYKLLLQERDLAIFQLQKDKKN